MDKSDAADESSGEDDQDDDAPRKLRRLSPDKEIPEASIVVDLTDDPESQDWLAEGRRKGRSNSFFEMSDEEREEVAKEAEKKLTDLKEEQNDDEDDRIDQ